MSSPSSSSSPSSFKFSAQAAAFVPGATTTTADKPTPKLSLILRIRAQRPYRLTRSKNLQNPARPSLLSRVMPGAAGMKKAEAKFSNVERDRIFNEAVKDAMKGMKKLAIGEKGANKSEKKGKGWEERKNEKGLVVDCGAANRVWGY